MKSNSLIKTIIIVLLLAGVSLSFVLTTKQSGKKAVSPYPAPKVLHKTQAPKTESDDSISIVAVGDIMLGTNYPDESCLPPKDSENLLLPALQELTNATLTFGNNEGSILNKGGKVKHCSNPKSCYAFRMPEHLIEYLKSSGFDVMNLANNHSGDFGPEGRSNALRVLERLGIGTCGLEEHPYAIVIRNNIKFGIIGFAPNDGTLNINKIDEAQAAIRDLRDKCDILIVSFHGGAEGRSRQHVPRKNEIFLKENRGNVYKFAHASIDAGADVVLGHGPHVARAMELYKKKIITYSLGNFCTYKRFGLKCECGYAPLLKVYISKKGDFIKGHISSYRQLCEGGPTPDSTGLVYQQIARLTNEDFTESKLKFPGQGEVLIK